MRKSTRPSFSLVSKVSHFGVVSDTGSKLCPKAWKRVTFVWEEYRPHSKFSSPWLKLENGLTTAILSVNHSFILWPTHLIFPPVRLFPMCFCQGFNFLFSVSWKGLNGGAVVRALASQDCAPGSNSGVDAIWRLSLLLVLSLAAPRGFLRALRFSPFLETQHFLFPIMADEKPLRKCATSKIVLYYLFILLTLFLL